MNLYQKQQNTIRYNSIPDAIADDDKTAAVPLGTTILSPTMTTMTRRHRSSKWMLAIVAIMMLLLVVLAGGTVWLRPEGGSSYDQSSGSLAIEDGSSDRTTAAAEGLVVATDARRNVCFPAGGDFGGVSTNGRQTWERLSL